MKMVRTANSFGQELTKLVVSFDGALTGVALGEWLYNTVFSTASCYPGSSILTSVVPARYLWYIEGHWKLFISQNGTSKFIVAPILCTFGANNSGVAHRNFQGVLVSIYQVGCIFDCCLVRWQQARTYKDRKRCFHVCDGCLPCK